MTGVIAIPEDELNVKHNPSWFISDANNAPKGSSFTYLINGQRTFEKLYDEIQSAKHTIDIAIWGFQPSMHFRRDGKSLNIGDLLIEKARNNVKVRVLVWAMTGYVQTMKEANMGNTGRAFLKGVEGVTEEQKDFDRAWYYVVGHDKPNPAPIAMIKVNEALRKYPKLHRFRQDPAKKNLIFKVRNVSFQINNYEDNLTFITKALLAGTRSHHQKTVLIDYEHPTLARGFILEHNMLDNYWDNDHHSIDKVEPNKGKNVSVPLQDISSFIKGGALYEINHNFCESWDRETKEGLLVKRNKIVRPKLKQYKVNNPVAIQVLRTYDKPNEEDIKELYLQNIKKTTSYIYTENQYFRWPPLVEEFKKYWQSLKSAGRKQPICWFVVTNSSDAGIGPGVENSDRMLKALGRRDVMPVVVTNRTARLDQEDKDIQKRYKTEKSDGSGVVSLYDPRERAPTYAELEQQAKPPIYGGRTAAEVKKVHQAYEEANKKLPEAREEFGQTLFKDLSNVIGIKSHICVLHSMYSEPKKWQEVYIHSKVTMINDVFLTMGSANINSRSMQDDTELNLALENSNIVKKLRKDLWQLNTRKSSATPDGMHLNDVTRSAFNEWKTLIDQNSELKKQKRKPQQPLSEFSRLSPEVTNMD